MPTHDGETHEFEFYGAWMGRKMYEALKDADVSKTEVFLMMIVQAFTMGKIGGCFASNRYLAGVLGIRQDGISKSIAKLKRLGFLIQRPGERRFLCTPWQEADAKTPRGSDPTPRGAAPTPVGAQPLPPRGAAPTITYKVEDTKKNSFSADADARSARLPAARKKAHTFRSGDISSKERSVPRAPDKGEDARSARSTPPSMIDMDAKRSSFAQRASIRLHEVIAARNGGRAPKFARIKWERALDALVSDFANGDGESRVEAALVWLEDLSNKWQIHSLKNFVEYFGQLEDRVVKNNSGTQGTDTKLDDASEKVVKEICRTIRARCGITDERLASVIRASYVNWKAMKKKWWHRVKPNQLRSSPALEAYDFADNKMQDIFRYAEDYLVSWFFRLYDDALGWDKWNGDITKFVFHLDHREFDNECCRLCREWSGTTKAWSLFKEQLR